QGRFARFDPAADGLDPVPADGVVELLSQVNEPLVVQGQHADARLEADDYVGAILAVRPNYVVLLHLDPRVAIDLVRGADLPGAVLSHFRNVLPFPALRLRQPVLNRRTTAFYYFMRTTEESHLFAPLFPFRGQSSSYVAALSVPGRKQS